MRNLAQARRRLAHAERELRQAQREAKQAPREWLTMTRDGAGQYLAGVAEAGPSGGPVSHVTLRGWMRDEGLPVAAFATKFLRTRAEWLDAWREHRAARAAVEDLAARAAVARRPRRQR